MRRVSRQGRGLAPILRDVCRSEVGYTLRIAPRGYCLRQRVARIKLNGPLGEAEPFLDYFCVMGPDRRESPYRAFVCTQALGAFPSCSINLADGNARLDRTNNRFRHPVLQVEDV